MPITYNFDPAILGQMGPAFLYFGLTSAWGVDENTKVFNLIDQGIKLEVKLNTAQMRADGVVFPINSTVIESDLPKITMMVTLPKKDDFNKAVMWASYGDRIEHLALPGYDLRKTAKKAKIVPIFDGEESTDLKSHIFIPYLSRPRIAGGFVFDNKGTPRNIPFEFDFYPDGQGRPMWIGENEPPVAAFSGDPLTGVHPLEVTFTDSSTNFPMFWLWDFGDGSTSTEQNPVHIYAAAGTYDVSLTVSHSNGSDVELKADYIVVT